MSHHLKLERRDQTSRTDTIAVPTGTVLVAPLVDEDYWTYRVRLTDEQSVVGFPKFFTIGIGFAVEEADWNTNLPYTSPVEQIADHIMPNKGDDSITRGDVINAIRLIQRAAHNDRKAALQ